MISFIIIIIACQVRCGLETASFYLENPAHRSWLAKNDIIAGLPCDDQAFLAGALFSFTTSPHLSPFSLSLVLWCSCSAPFANNSHNTPYLLFPLSFISLLFSFRTSFAAFLALLPCEKTLYAGTLLSTYSRQLDDIIVSPPPAASFSDHIQHIPKPTLPSSSYGWVGDTFLHKWCPHISFTVLINY